MVYSGQMFCAGMTTTQQSESMNSQLKFYVNTSSISSDFFFTLPKDARSPLLRRFEGLFSFTSNDSNTVCRGYNT